MSFPACRSFGSPRLRRVGAGVSLALAGPGNPSDLQKCSKDELIDLILLLIKKVDIAAGRLLIYHTASLANEGKPFTLEASVAKLFTSEMAMRVCNKAIQIHGGYGYIREFPVERYLRDAKLCEIGEGTSEVQRLVISRELLK